MPVSMMSMVMTQYRCVFVHVHVSVCLLNGKAIFMVSTICLKGPERLMKRPHGGSAR